MKATTIVKCNSSHGVQGKQQLSRLPQNQQVSSRCRQAVFFHVVVEILNIQKLIPIVSR